MFYIIDINDAFVLLGSVQKEFLLMKGFGHTYKKNEFYRMGSQYLSTPSPRDHTMFPHVLVLIIKIVSLMLL